MVLPVQNISSCLLSLLHTMLYKQSLTNSIIANVISFHKIQGTSLSLQLFIQVKLGFNPSQVHQILHRNQSIQLMPVPTICHIFGETSWIKQYNLPTNDQNFCGNCFLRAKFQCSLALHTNMKSTMASFCRKSFQITCTYG